MTNIINKSFPTYDEYPDFLKKMGRTKQHKDYKQYLKQFAFFNLAEDILPSAAFILNFETQQYLFMSNNCQAISGYTAKEYMEMGRELCLAIIHPDDIKILSDIAFAKLIEFIKQIPPKEVKKYRFSLNYRIKRKDGVYIKLLHQYIIIEVNDKGYPVLSLGLVTDITTHKTDDKIMLTATKYGKGIDIKVLYSGSLPHQSPTLSKRELEIMKYVLRGLSSNKIAEKLFVSPYTIIAHRRNILAKTKCHNLSELSRYALLNGLG